MPDWGIYILIASFTCGNETLNYSRIVKINNLILQQLDFLDRSAIELSYQMFV